MILLHYSYVLGYNSFNTVTFVQSSELQEGFVRPRLLQWSDYNWEDLELIAISYPFKKEQEMHLFISHFLPEEIVCVFEGNREDFKNIFSPCPALLVVWNYYRFVTIPCSTPPFYRPDYYFPNHLRSQKEDCYKITCKQLCWSAGCTMNQRDFSVSRKMNARLWF